MGGLGKKSYPPARGFYPWQACGTFFVTETEFAAIGATWSFLCPADRLRLLLSSATIRRAFVRLFVDVAVHHGLGRGVCAGHRSTARELSDAGGA